MNDKSIYDSNRVRDLFDEMAATYGIVNLISSFGFTVWWRRQCARSIDVKPDSVVLDLMTGMGELCSVLGPRLDSQGALFALDLSPVMCREAKKLTFENDYRVLEADALACPIADETIDCVFSSFGLKTFDDQQTTRLAFEVYRVLKPGGTFSFLEISVPPNRFLRAVYMFYLRKVIPLLGRLLMGNPDNYRMLGVYTTAFQNCRVATDLFAANGLQAEFRSYFFGCATGIVGKKPAQ